MGFFSDIGNAIFGDPTEGYDDAIAASGRRYDESLGYLKPYSEGGMVANDKLNELFKQLSNPQGLENQWSSGYQESPYAKQLERGSFDRGLNAASSMGLGGSSAALNNIQEESSGIMNQDRQQYMNDLMQKYLAGMGIVQNQFNTGAGAAGSMAGNAIGQGNNEAGLAFGRANAQNNQNAGLLGSIASIGLAPFTGGMSLMGLPGMISGMGGGGGGAGSGMFKNPSMGGNMSGGDFGLSQGWGWGGI